LPRRGGARRRARRVWIGLGIALFIEFIAIFLGPYAANASISVSLAKCPPPLLNATQVLEGKLIVIVESLYMRIPGAKRIEPALEVFLENGSTEIIALGVVNGSEVSMSDVVRVINDFVGPLESIDVGDNVTKAFAPPRVMYYDKLNKEYVLRYFYPGINLVGEIRVKPLYHRYRIELKVNRSTEIILGLCTGTHCRYVKHLCTPPRCIVEGYSKTPFQYVSIGLKYRCGLFEARFINIYGQVKLYARDNYRWLLALYGIVAAITIAIAICVSKKFK